MSCFCILWFQIKGLSLQKKKSNQHKYSNLVFSGLFMSGKDVNYEILTASIPTNIVTKHTGDDL